MRSSKARRVLFTASCDFLGIAYVLPHYFLHEEVKI
jgi:hypothetical protein